MVVTSPCGEFGVDFFVALAAGNVLTPCFGWQGVFGWCGFDSIRRVLIHRLEPAAISGGSSRVSARFSFSWMS